MEIRAQASKGEGKSQKAEPSSPVSAIAPHENGQHSQSDNEKHVDAEVRIVSAPQKDVYDIAVIWADFALVVVGAIGIVVGIRTLCILKRQAKANVVAARAALKQANHMVAAERAWLLISAEKSNQKWSEDRSFYWTIKNVGRTPARLIATQARCEIMESLGDPPPTPEYDPPIPLNERILAPGDSMRFKTFWGARDKERGCFGVFAQSSEPLDGFYLLAWGHVQYLNLFGDTCESRFCDEYRFVKELDLPDYTLKFRPRLDVPAEYTKHT